MTHDEDTALAGSAGVAGASRVGEVRRKSGHLVADSNGGWCLVAHDFDSIVANPPTDPQAFAELVVELDGGGVDNPPYLFQS